MPCLSDARHCLHCERNSWQRLGNMNPDAAMEQYVALVSDKIPGWMEENSAVSPSGFLQAVVLFDFFSYFYHREYLANFFYTILSTGRP